MNDRPLDDFLEGFLAEHRDELIAFRRHLHAFPELSGGEHETTELIAQRLRISGLEPLTLSSGTGLLCEIDRGGSRRIALRADIDALAMTDTKHVPYRSKVEGVAHACGHDMHTAIVLGAGLALTRCLSEGSVRLVFEPAEETVPGGAVTVIHDGGLDEVDAMFGFHCDPKLDVGQVGLRAGPLTSAADMVQVEISGPGGHTARPHLTVDLVGLAGRLASELGPCVRDQPGGETLSVVFGALHTGDAANVIPTTAALRGSVRTADVAAWAGAEELVRAAIASIVEPAGASFTLHYTRGVPPVNNDPAEVERMRGIVAGLDGVSAVEAVQSAGGDTFAWYTEHVPGCLARLGVHGPASGDDRLDLHSGAFDVDERALDVGIRVLVATALRALEHPG